MIGYKAFNKDLTCRGFQYEVGKTYEMDEIPKACITGFHFCKSIGDCYEYYEKSDDTRICKVEALGKIDTDDDIKFVTNKIAILEEVIEDWKKKGNSNSSNTGYCNSGNWNSGNRNSGNRNSGNWNSGYWNSGYCNSGNRNSGNWNSGDYNSGNWNSGDYNSGNWNSGNWNSGYCNSGLFNTDKSPKIKMFDKESDWTIKDWLNSRAINIMANCPFSHSEFINESEMTDLEKEEHPEYTIIGGYVKNIKVTKENKLKWWEDLDDEDKESIKSLPNFDFEKFKECVGMK